MADATGNIIFTIGSKVGGGGMASIKAAIDMLGQMANSVKEGIKELDKFAMAWERTNQAAVVAADTAAAGLVDTTEVMKGYNRLVTAGANVTDEQFKTLTVRAVQLAKATGEDATQAFERLTKGISKGSSRALAEYGIKLKESSDLQATQTTAIKAMTEGFENLTVEAETASEQLFALENNLDTFQALMWQAAGRSETFSSIIGELNTAFGDLNKMLAEAPETMSNFIFSGEAVTGMLAEMGSVLIEYVLEPLALAEEGWRSFLNIGGESAIRKKITSMKASLGEVAAASLEGLGQAVEAERVARAEAGLGTGAGIKKRPRGGARGRGGAAKKPKIATGEVAAAIFGETGTQAELSPYDIRAGMDITGAGADITRAASMTDIIGDTSQDTIAVYEQEIAAMDAATDALFTQEEQRLFMFEEETFRQEMKAQWRTEEMIQREEDDLYTEYIIERHRYQYEEMLGVENSYLVASRKRWDQGLKGKAESMSLFLHSIASLQEFENERNFNAFKVLNIAITTVDTIRGAISAYSAMAGIPYVGPVLGIIAAAAVTAAGAAAVAKIASTSYSKGGGTSSGISAPSMGAGGGPSPESMSGPGAGGGTPGEDRGREVTINVRMDDSAAMFGVLVDENDKASQRGERGFRGA